MPCKPTTSWNSVTAPTNAFATPAAPTSAWTNPNALQPTFSACCAGDQTPSLTSISPTTGVAGTTVSVILIGANFAAATTIIVSGSGITAQNVVVVSDTEITADLVITGAAALNARTVTVTTAFGTSGSVSFTPTDAHLELWLDATDSPHITIATGVSSWADKTGNGRALTQATGSKQPTVVPALLNGLAGVRFDGVDDFLSAAIAVELKNGSTVFAVAGVNFANTTKGHGLFRLTSNPTGLQHEPSNDPNVPSRSKLESFANTNAGLIRATPAAVTTTGARLLTAYVAPADPAVTLRKNGVVVGGPTAGFATISTSVGDTWRLCTDENESTVCGQYDVFELLVYSRALTSAEITTAETALLTKWGLP